MCYYKTCPKQEQRKSQGYRTVSKVYSHFMKNWDKKIHKLVQAQGISGWIQKKVATKAPQGSEREYWGKNNVYFSLYIHYF